jgi:hypothetical protein
MKKTIPAAQRTSALAGCNVRNLVRPVSFAPSYERVFVEFASTCRIAVWPNQDNLACRGNK